MSQEQQTPQAGQVPQEDSFNDISFDRATVEAQAQAVGIDYSQGNKSLPKAEGTEFVTADVGRDMTPSVDAMHTVQQADHLEMQQAFFDQSTAHVGGDAGVNDSGSAGGDSSGSSGDAAGSADTSTVETSEAKPLPGFTGPVQVTQPDRQRNRRERERRDQDVADVNESEAVAEKQLGVSSHDDAYEPEHTLAETNAIAQDTMKRAEVPYEDARKQREAAAASREASKKRGFAGQKSNKKQSSKQAKKSYTEDTRPANEEEQLKALGEALGEQTEAYQEDVKQAPIFGQKMRREERMQQLKKQHDIHGYSMVGACMLPLMQGVNAKSVIGVAGLATVLWCMSPKFRDELGMYLPGVKRGIAEHTQDSVNTIMKPGFFAKGTKRAQVKEEADAFVNRVKSRINIALGRELPFTTDSAARMVVGTAENAFHAMRVEGADPKAVEVEYKETLDDIYSFACASKLDINEVNQRARTIVGVRAKSDPKAAAMFEETAYGNFTPSPDTQFSMKDANDHITAAYKYAGDWESQTGAKIIAKSAFFTPRKPSEKADDHGHFSASLVRDSLAPFVEADDLEGIRDVMVGYYGVMNGAAHGEQDLMESVAPSSTTAKAASHFMKLRALCEADGLSEQQIKDNMLSAVQNGIGAVAKEHAEHAHVFTDFDNTFGDSWMTQDVAQFVDNPMLYIAEHCKPENEQSLMSSYELTMRRRLQILQTMDTDELESLSTGQVGRMQEAQASVQHGKIIDLSAFREQMAMRSEEVEVATATAAASAAAWAVPRVQPQDDRTIVVGDDVRSTLPHIDKQVKHEEPMKVDAAVVKSPEANAVEHAEPGVSSDAQVSTEPVATTVDQSASTTSSGTPAHMPRKNDTVAARIRAARQMQSVHVQPLQEQFAAEVGVGDSVAGDVAGDGAVGTGAEDAGHGQIQASNDHGEYSVVDNDAHPSDDDERSEAKEKERTAEQVRETSLGDVSGSVVNNISDKRLKERILQRQRNVERQRRIRERTMRANANQQDNLMYDLEQASGNTAEEAAIINEMNSRTVHGGGIGSAAERRFDDISKRVATEQSEAQHTQQQAQRRAQEQARTRSKLDGPELG